jgi:hypothetical protein
MNSKNIILLGAGASRAAGIPTAYEMTRSIIDQVEKEDPLYARTLRFVAGGLLFQTGVRGEDPFGGVDVEELFSAVLLLADRNTLEAAPFIGSWHPMVERLDQQPPSSYVLEQFFREIHQDITNTVIETFPNPPAFTHMDIERAIQEAVSAALKSGHYRSSSFGGPGRVIQEGIGKWLKAWLQGMKAQRPNSHNFARSLSQILLGLRSPGEGGNYRRLASAMTATLAKIAWIDEPEKVKYLDPILQIAAKQKRLTIASLNYDNALEILFGTAGIDLERGIESWTSEGKLAESAAGPVLLKLHGSIDWALEMPSRSQRLQMPRAKLVAKNASEVGQGYKPAIVFGQRNKLTAEGPFLDLLSAFRRELSLSSKLIVVGYSFRDAHINEYISQWLNERDERTITVIDPGFNESQVPYTRDLMQYTGSRINVIQEPAERGLAQLLEEEQSLAG